MGGWKFPALEGWRSLKRLGMKELDSWIDHISALGYLGAGW